MQWLYIVNTLLLHDYLNLILHFTRLMICWSSTCWLIHFMKINYFSDTSPYLKVLQVTFMMLSDDIALLQTSWYSSVTISTRIKYRCFQCSETLAVVSFWTWWMWTTISCFKAVRAGHLVDAGRLNPLWGREGESLQHSQSVGTSGIRLFVLIPYLLFLGRPSLSQRGAPRVDVVFSVCKGFKPS